MKLVLCARASGETTSPCFRRPVEARWCHCLASSTTFSALIHHSDCQACHSGHIASGLPVPDCRVVLRFETTRTQDGDRRFQRGFFKEKERTITEITNSNPEPLSCSVKKTAGATPRPYQSNAKLNVLCRSVLFLGQYL